MKSFDQFVENDLKPLLNQRAIDGLEYDSARLSWLDDVFNAQERGDNFIEINSLHSKSGLPRILSVADVERL